MKHPVGPVLLRGNKMLFILSISAFQAPVLEAFLRQEECASLRGLRKKYGRAAAKAVSNAQNPPPLPLAKLCVAVESMWTLSVMVEPLVGKLRDCLRNSKFLRYIV